MGITFFETMSGEVQDHFGETHHLAMDIRCDASSLTRFARTGTAAVSGTIRARPWVDGVACEGSIVVSPVKGRRIAYSVTFEDADGTAWHLHGKKSISALHPITSMTVMAAQLDRAGVKHATGTLMFQLNDLLPFLLSWRIGNTVRPSRDARQAPPLISQQPLSPAERQTLGAFAEAIITPGGNVPAADAQTRSDTEALLARLPSHLQLAIRAGLVTLNATSRTRYRRRFAQLSLPRRKAIVAKFRRTTGGELTVLALGMPVKMAHFSRRDYLSQIGLPRYQESQAEPPQRWQQSVLTPGELESRTVVECDVVVVGTGAGGGPVAASLAEQGHGVVMVEEGRLFDRSDFSANPIDRMLTMWRDGGMNLSIGNTPVGVPVGMTVGGSTTINSGIAIRTPDRILNEWRSAGFPTDFAPESFAPYLNRVERELGVGPGEQKHLGQVAQIVARGAQQMGAKHGALPRNSPGCDGQGQCVFGCPSDAKRGSNLSWVPRAMKAGAGLYTQMRVTRILMRADRAVGVLASGQDENGAKRTLEIRAKAVVIAAGALHTPLLLQRNGVRLPQLGRNLSIHPALGMLVRMPDADTNPWHSIPMGYFADSQSDPLVKFEGFYVPPQLAAATMSLDGPELTGWMDDWGRVGQFGFMVRDHGVGRVSAGPGGSPLVRYSITPRVLQAFQRGSAELAEMLIRGGGTQVETRIAGVGPVSDIHCARAITQTKLKPRDFRSMGFHPLGTARLGTSSATAALDFDHQVFGKRDLFVVDGAAVPTSLGVNPQVTIMATALRAADVIGERLDRAQCAQTPIQLPRELQPT